MKKLIFFVTTILSFFLILFSLTSCGDDRENNGSLLDSARSIKVVGIEGSATVSDDKEELECFKGMNLYDGDTLNIGSDSVLIIKFDEDKYVYLGENTTINIKSEGKEKYKTNIFVEKGIDGIVLSCGMYNVHSVTEYTYVDDLIKGAELVAKILVD